MVTRYLPPLPRLTATTSELAHALLPLTCDGVAVSDDPPPDADGWLTDLLADEAPLRVVLPPSMADDEALLSLGLLLTRRSVAEIVVASPRDPDLVRLVLRSLELVRVGVDIVACPTCGRCRQPIESIVLAVRAATAHVTRPLTVAVMGCEVNGPGEASHADCGVAASATGGILFRRGEIVRRCRGDELVQALLDEIQSLVDEDGGDR